MTLLMLFMARQNGNSTKQLPTATYCPPYPFAGTSRRCQYSVWYTALHIFNVLLFATIFVIVCYWIKFSVCYKIIFRVAFNQESCNGISCMLIKSRHILASFISPACRRDVWNKIVKTTAIESAFVLSSLADRHSCWQTNTLILLQVVIACISYKGGLIVYLCSITY